MSVNCSIILEKLLIKTILSIFNLGCKVRIIQCNIGYISGSSKETFKLEPAVVSKLKKAGKGRSPINLKL